MKTRTKKSTTRSSSGQSQSAGSNQVQDQAQQLSQRVEEPPRLTVLPKGLSNDAHIVLLPRSCDVKQKGHFLLCPTAGCFEFTSIGDDKGHKSWLLTPSDLQDHGTAMAEKLDEAYILQKPQVLVATPIDPSFMVLPMMTAADVGCPGMYRTWTDILYDEQTDQWQPLRQLLAQTQWQNVQQQLEGSMAKICDVLELGDGEDATYRLSCSKVAECLLQKAIKTVNTGFPTSMEDHFVKQILELPSHDVIDTDEEISTSTQTAVDSQSSEPSQSTNDSQTTTESKSTVATSVSNSSTQLVVSDNIRNLLRIRTTFDFMLRSYVPGALHEKVKEALAALQDTLNFEPLVTLESKIHNRRTEVQALRTLSDNISRKRKLDDDEAADKAEEKRRKKEDEDAKKKSMSHGVKKLMKADTSGMKKLSSFFMKKAAA